MPSPRDVKIISIGAAVQDVFLQGKIFKPQHEDDGDVAEFKLGSKNEVENVTYSTGGGATNAAVTFARGGLHSCYMGRVGHDIAGQAVLNELHSESVDTSLTKDSKRGTGYSTLLVAPNGERTILVYRGASDDFDFHVSDFHGVQADWFYVSALSGDFETLETIIEYAKANDIKVALNPGKGELEHKARFKALLPFIEMLGANKQEMQMLFNHEESVDLVRAASAHVPYVVLTDGPKGSMATDGTKLYKAGMYEDVKVTDRTGAGDAYNSGFVASIAKGKDMIEALTFAAANSTSVVQQIGAKAGILRKSALPHSMPITVSDI